MEFKKAVKTKQWLRLAIDGISGSGKTMTALRIGYGIAKSIKGKIALIDSEHGSASLYADRFEFDTLELAQFQIEDYTEALNAAAKAGYEIVIIDSTSHAWDALVERVERIAQQKFNGNTFRAWAEGTPLQKKLIEAMLSYPGHVIATCRSKTEYSVDKDDKGKTTVKKVGTAAVQRQGFEYEFTLAMTLDGNHVGMFSKDRTGKFQDKFFEKPDEKLGEQLIAWLNEGANPAVVSVPKSDIAANAELTGAGQDTVQSKPKTERQIVIDGIVATLQSRNPDELEFFTEEEKKKVKADISKTKEITALKKLAADWEKELNKRKAEYKPIPFGDAPGTVHSAGTMTARDDQTTTGKKTAEPEDDSFEDDVPWGDKPETAKAGASDELDIY